MRQLTTADELAHACAADPLCVWAGQGMADGVRAWAAEGAVAVASPDLCGRDRLAVHGPAETAVPLIAEVLPHLGPSYRLLGDSGLVTTAAERIPGLTESPAWTWMDCSTPPQEPAGAARWLAEDELAAVSEVLDEGFPDAYARPGGIGVRRWAGAHDPAGRLVAVAADAWSAPALGFMAGVAVRPSARGQGLARVICSFVVGELLDAHGHVALMVDDCNTIAVHTYRRLGFTGRVIRSARTV
jgi:ribosomal protein S18 acetylase RimI-like enzyme